MLTLDELLEEVPSRPPSEDWAVIFDMDGVIVDNAYYHYLAWHDACLAHGITLEENYYQTQLNGRTMADTLKELFKRPLSAEEIHHFAEQKEQKYRDLYAPHIKPHRGLLELLQALDAKGVDMAVATSAPPENVSFTLGHTQTQRYLWQVVDASMVSKGKPDPEVYLKAAALLEKKPEQCIVFEDAILGIEAALNAGMIVVGVATTHPAEKLHRAQRVIKDFSELELEDLVALLGTR